MKKRGRDKKKVIVGLTGSFASGKSTVAGLFRSFGARVIDADKIAHSLARPGSEIYKRIIDIFGRGILKDSGMIDRAKLARIVFGNKRLLKRLNKAVHPAVIRIIKKKIDSTTGKVIVLDAPLLMEAGLEGVADKLIVVTVTPKKQIERARRRTGLGRLDILKRINAQIPLSRKVRLADFIIDNNGTVKETRKQVLQLRRLLWRS